MALTDLAKDVDNIKDREADVFVRESGTDGTANYVDFGIVGDASISIESTTTDAGNHGREATLTLNITLEFTLRQTSDTELGVVETLAGRQSSSYKDGRVVAVSEVPVDVSEINNNLDTSGIYNGSKDIWTFKHIILVPSGELDLSGDQSDLGFSGSTSVPLSELSNLANNGVMDFA